jgi:hypothetical protein
MAETGDPSAKTPAADQQPGNPLHGVKLEAIVTALADHYGWEELGQRINIRCFTSEPSVPSSLKLLHADAHLLVPTSRPACSRCRAAARTSRTACRCARSALARRAGGASPGHGHLGPVADGAWHRHAAAC